MDRQKPKYNVPVIHNADDMMKVFRAASGSVFKLIRSDPTSLKKIIKNLLANYQTIKSQVPVSEKNKAIMEELESFNAVFELFDMQRKIEAGTFSIDSMNFKLLRKQLILAHPNQETFELLSIIYAEFNIFFLSIDYLDMARLIIMLQNDLITRMRKKFLETTFDDVEKDRASLTLGGKHSEIFYLEKLLVTSCRMMKKDNSWTEEQEKREGICRDVLTKLRVEEIFADVPKMVQHFKQAQKLSQMIFPMIDDYELHYHEYLRKFEVEPRSNPKLYIGYWRGQIYNILKEFQKESSLQIELIEQSINHWEKWLSELFSKEQLQEYLQNKDEITMHTYLTILKFHIDNYEKYIGSKAYDLMQLPVDDFDVKKLLKELNLLRSNYIMVLKRVINFGNKRPDKVSLELQQTINRGLSTQYRSIILENKESQRKNLETSKKYLLQFCKLSAIRGDELLPNASAETKILTFCLICDKDEFIQKFRSD